MLSLSIWFVALAIATNGIRFTSYCKPGRGEIHDNEGNEIHTFPPMETVQFGVGEEWKWVNDPECWMSVETGLKSNARLFDQALNANPHTVRFGFESPPLAHQEQQQQPPPLSIGPSRRQRRQQQQGAQHTVSSPELLGQLTPQTSRSLVRRERHGALGGAEQPHTVTGNVNTQSTVRGQQRRQQQHMVLHFDEYLAAKLEEMLEQLKVKIHDQHKCQILQEIKKAAEQNRLLHKIEEWAESAGVSLDGSCPLAYLKEVMFDNGRMQHVLQRIKHEAEVRGYTLQEVEEAMAMTDTEFDFSNIHQYGVPTPPETRKTKPKTRKSKGKKKGKKKRKRKQNIINIGRIPEEQAAREAAWVPGQEATQQTAQQTAETEAAQQTAERAHVDYFNDYILFNDGPQYDDYHEMKGSIHLEYDDKHDHGQQSQNVYGLDYINYIEVMVMIMVIISIMIISICCCLLFGFGIYFFKPGEIKKVSCNEIENILYDIV